MLKKAIVTLADSKYFELLNELINSILNFKQSSEIKICVLDAGLTDNQKKKYQKKFTLLKKLIGIFQFLLQGNEKRLA